MFCDQRNVAWEKESLNVVQDIRLSYCSVWCQQGPNRTSGQDRYAPRRARRGRLREYFATLPEQLERLISETREGTLSPMQRSVIGSRFLPPRNFTTDCPKQSPAHRIPPGLFCILRQTTSVRALSGIRQGANPPLCRSF